MLLETDVGKIGAKVIFNERQKHDPKLLTNPNLNEEVTM